MPARRKLKDSLNDGYAWQNAYAAALVELDPKQIEAARKIMRRRLIELAHGSDVWGECEPIKDALLALTCLESANEQAVT